MAGLSLPGANTYVLQTPWSFFDKKAEAAGYGRLLLGASEIPIVRSGRPILIAAPRGATVRPSGFKMAAHPLPGRCWTMDGEYQLFLLSVGVRPSEGDIDIEVDGVPSGKIHVEGYVPRPTFSAGRFGTNTPEWRAEQLDLFLLGLIDLVQMVRDPDYEKYQIVWDRLQNAWMDETAERSIPPLSLIVRHADHYANLVRDLLSKPRRFLRRQRELTPIDRVQQLDIACVRWLSRQPGNTHYERAGPRQRILAVQRDETLDTLENRVMRDFCMRTHREATRYTKRYERFRDTFRWASVNRHGQRGKRAVGALVEAGVTNVSPPVTPNFVLLQDSRYRHLWRAYLEILRLQDEEDECWRWQHRLWNDFVHLLVHLSLRQIHGAFQVAEQPLRINHEQERGIWTALGDLSGVWQIDLGKTGNEADAIVLSLIWNLSENPPDFAAWAPGLGCDAFIRAQRLSDQSEAYIALWGYHTFSAETEDVAVVAQSCDRAIQTMTTVYGHSTDTDFRLKGLVLLSTPFGLSRSIDSTAVPQPRRPKPHDYLPNHPHERSAHEERASVLRVGSNRTDLIHAMSRIRMIVIAQLQSLFDES